MLLLLLPFYIQSMNMVPWQKIEPDWKAGIPKYSLKWLLTPTSDHKYHCAFVEVKDTDNLLSVLQWKTAMNQANIPQDITNKIVSFYKHLICEERDNYTMQEYGISYKSYRDFMHAYANKPQMRSGEWGYYLGQIQDENPEVCLNRLSTAVKDIDGRYEVTYEDYHNASNHDKRTLLYLRENSRCYISYGEKVLMLTQATDNFASKMFKRIDQLPLHIKKKIASKIEIFVQTKDLSYIDMPFGVDFHARFNRFCKLMDPISIVCASLSLLWVFGVPITKLYHIKQNGLYIPPSTSCRAVNDLLIYTGSFFVTILAAPLIIFIFYRGIEFVLKKYIVEMGNKRVKACFTKMELSLEE
jgi:hypothetical protein